MTLKNKFLYLKIHHKGGWVGDVVGGITEGLIGNDPKEEARKEAERKRKQQEELIRQQEADREKEENFNKEVAEDKKEMQDNLTEEIKKGKPQTTVDFSQSIKGTGTEDEEEDKLRKSLRKAFRG